MINSEVFQLILTKIVGKRFMYSIMYAYVLSVSENKLVRF